MSKFDTMLDEMVDAGQLAPHIADAISKASAEEAPILRAEIKQFRREAEELEAQLDGLHRDSVVTAAGLGHLNERQRQVLFDNHEGELTSEAVWATAGELWPPSEPVA